MRKSGKKLKIGLSILGIFAVLAILVLSSTAPPSLLPTEEEDTQVIFDEPLVLNFSQMMNKRSVQQAFSISPKVAGKFEWVDYKTLEFHPEKPLRLETQYEVTLKNTARSLWFKKMEGENFQDFITTGPPAIIFKNPEEQGQLNTGKGLTVMFDRPMAFAEIPATDLIRTTPKLDGEIKYIGQSAFQFLPKNVEPETDYKIEVPEGLLALEGGKTREGSVWTVKTGSNQVIQSIPEENQTIGVNQALEIHFDQTIDLNQILPGKNAQLFPSNDLQEGKKDGFFNTEVRYGVDKEGKKNNTVLLFTPSFPFKDNQNYEFVLKAEEGLNLNEDFHLKFKASNQVESNSEAGFLQNNEEEKITWPSNFVNNFSQKEDSPNATKLELLLNQTDFKIGDTLQLKGILRTGEGDNLGLSETKEAKFQLLNAKGSSVLEKSIPVDEGGNLIAKIILPESLKGGAYEALLKDEEGKILTEGLFIQIQQNEMALNLEWNELETDYEENQLQNLNLQATHQNGLPALGLKGKYQIYRKPLSNNYQQSGWEYSFGSLEEGCEADCDQWEQVKENPLNFDETGKANIDFSKDAETILKPGFEYQILANAGWNAENQTTTRKHFKIHNTDLEVGIGLNTDKLEAGQKIEARIIALDGEEKMTPDKTIAVSVFNSQAPNELIDRKTTVTKNTPVSVIFPFDSEIKEGTYILKAEYKDAQDRGTITEKEFYLGDNSSSTIEDQDTERKIEIEMNLEPSNPKPGANTTLHFQTNNSEGSPLSTTLALNILADEKSISFNPSLKTDDKGEGSLEFKIPTGAEKLNFQILARAGVNQTGFVEKEINLGNISLRPILPEVMVPGDETTFSVLAKNNSLVALNSSIRLDGDYVIAAQKSQNIHLEAGEEKQVQFKVKLDPNLEAKTLKINFISGNVNSERTLQVLHAEQWIDLIKNPSVESVWSTLISIPKNVYPNKGTLSFKAGLSLKPLIENWKTALEEVEQDSPYISAAQLIAEVQGGLNQENKVALQKKVNALMAKNLVSGAYAWWENGEKEPKLTAIVVTALSQAKEASLEVNRGKLEASHKYLLSSLSEPELSISDQIFITWVLSEDEIYDTEKTLRLFKEVQPNDFQGRAFLLMTLKNLQEAGQKSLIPFMERLKNDLATDITKNKKGWFFGGGLDSKNISTATLFYALSKVSPDNPLLPKMTDYLLTQDSDSNPQEAMWMILALQAANNKLEEGGENKVLFKLNTKNLGEKEFEAKSQKVYDFSLPAGTLETDKLNSLLITKENLGKLYVDGYIKTFLNPEKLEPVEKKAILVQQIYKAEDPQKLAVTQLKKGIKYKSHLMLIVSEDLAGVAINVPATAGLWSLPETPTSPFDKVENTKSGRQYFASHLPAGVYEMETDLQPLVSGHYHQLPATLTSIVQPEVFARAKSQLIQID